MNTQFFRKTLSRRIVPVFCRRPPPITRTSLGYRYATMITKQEYRLNGGLDLKNGQKCEVEVDGIRDGKVLLVKINDQLRALGSRCTHYGAPLVKGTLAGDGRITCPWHGACFNTDSGDIENAPALDHLNSYPVSVKNGSVYITGDEASIKAGRRVPDIRCSPVKTAGAEHVVIVGGGSGAMGAVEGLREKGFKGAVTVLSKESYLPIDRTKLSKALIPDAAKVQWRSEEHFKSAGVDFHLSTEVKSVDFKNRKISTMDKGEFNYTKVLFATGGTPKRLPMKGFKELGNIFVLRGVDDVQRILKAVGEKGKKIVVIGSSFIGMEVSNALTKENNVTIVGMEGTPLERVMGPKVGAIFQRLLEKGGVKFRMNASVESAEPSSTDSSKVGAISLKDGENIEADLVILGVGVAPATEYFKNSGIELEKDGSIQVDEYFRIKGQEDAYAVGDIATYPYHGPGTKPTTGTLTRIEHWNVAQNSGRQAAAHIAAEIKPTHFIPTFWSALGIQLRYCGNTPNGYDDVIVQGEPEESKFVAYYTLGEEVVAVATMQSDPVMTQCAELMRRKAMPGKKDLLGGADVLKIEVPAGVRI